MPELTLNDSDFLGKVQKGRNEGSAAIIKAVDTLCAQFNEGKIKILQLGGYAKPRYPECPVSYKIESLESLYNTSIVDTCRFFSSHYIGMAVIDGVTIRIKPSKGSTHLLRYAMNVYIPESEVKQLISEGKGNYWMLAMLWKTFLNKALAEGMIPKEYVKMSENRRSFRGHLNVHKQIAFNLIKAHRFYCDYNKLSLDNTINRTIRYTFRILNDARCGAFINEFSAYDQKLESFGVHNGPIDVTELDKIHYNRLTAPYKEIMNICRNIVTCRNAELEKGDVKSFSYFVDVAELWEVYLLKTLQRNLPSEYTVYSPNTGHGVFLLDNSSREIRPDIIIELDNNVLMIIDAKYKRYSKFGRSAAEPGAVSREDLYQMNTYLYHYGTPGRKIMGVFSAPAVSEENDIYTYTTTPLHSIGLINLPIPDREDNAELIHAAEKQYIDNIIKALERLSSN